MAAPTSGDNPPHTFSQTFRLTNELRATEDRVLDGQPAAQIQFAGMQARTGRLLAILKRSFALSLRWTTIAIFLSPVLLVAQALVDHGWPIVIFVGIVTLFFGTLNLYLLVSAVHWLRTRHAEPGPPFDRLLRELTYGRALLFEGTVRSIERGPAHAPLWTDLFVDTVPEKRVAFGDDFVVVADGQEPLFVRVETSPHVFGKVEQVTMDRIPTPVRRLLGVGRGDEGLRGVSIRSGDRVQIWTRGAPTRVGPLSGFQLGRRTRSFHSEEASGAYRDAGHGQLIGCSVADRLTIRVL